MPTYKILIIDDDPVMRTLVEGIIKNDGYDAESAADGLKGMKIYHGSAKKKPFDLIILDITMPHLNGIEVLKGIRQEEEDRGIIYGVGNTVPIIMLTASKESWLDAFDLGCDDYVVKPFESHQLLAKIHEKLQ